MPLTRAKFKESRARVLCCLGRGVDYQDHMVQELCCSGKFAIWLPREPCDAVRVLRWCWSG